MGYELHDIIGNVGIIFILGSYFLLQLERLKVSDRRYSAANAIGAALILYSLHFDFNLSAFVIEAAWLVISLFGLFKSFQARR